MPLGTARITRLAIALCGLAVISVLNGCTAFSASKPMAAPQPLTPANTWLYPLETITGGMMGDKFTGIAQQRLQRPVAVAVRDHVLYIVDAGAQMLYRYDDLTKRLSVLKDLRSVVSGEVPDIYVAADRSYYLADADGLHAIASNADTVLASGKNRRSTPTLSLMTSFDLANVIGSISAVIERIDPTRVERPAWPAAGGKRTGAGPLSRIVT